MEERNVVEGRSWHSMKERYLKVIRKAIKEKTELYGLDPEHQQRLRS